MEKFSCRKAKEVLIKDISSCLLYIDSCDITRTDANTVHLLKGEMANLNRNQMSGLMSFDQIALAKNQIRARILSLIDEIAKSEGEIVPSSKEKTMKNNLDSLFADRIFKATHPSLWKEVSDMREELRKHRDQKESSPTYDISGRIGSALDRKEDLLMRAIREAMLDKKEEFADVFTPLESDDVTWEQIHKAYRVVKGRNGNLHSVSAALDARPNDLVSKITAAVAILEWVAANAK
jgi:Effector-associated domain 11